MTKGVWQEPVFGLGVKRTTSSNIAGGPNGWHSGPLLTLYGWTPLLVVGFLLAFTPMVYAS